MTASTGTVLRSVVVGCGSALPARCVTNDKLSRTVDTSDDWIVQRTGIRQRYLADASETTSVLGARAARAALDEAGLTADDIDLIICATSTPDHTFPSTATEIQAALGLRGGFAFDVQAVCAGFVYAVTTADKFLSTGAPSAPSSSGPRRFRGSSTGRTGRPACCSGTGRAPSCWKPAKGRAPPQTAACSPRACAPTAVTAKSSTSMAGRAPPAPPGTCG